jgi:hypothetical protein
MREQDYDAEITWTQDWLRHLAINSGVSIIGKTDAAIKTALLALDDPLTITAATATCDDDRVTVDSVTVTDDGTSVTFHVSQDGITEATTITITVAVTLSDDDEDERNFEILVTDT